jgi:hypothetical protein
LLLHLLLLLVVLQSAQRWPAREGSLLHWQPNSSAGGSEIDDADRHGQQWQQQQQQVQLHVMLWLMLRSKQQWPVRAAEGSLRPWQLQSSASKRGSKQQQQVQLPTMM